jgi:hypothetical protein
MIKSYEHHSPSGLNLFVAEPAMFVFERVLGHKQTVGAPAHRGSAVEQGVTYALLNPDKSLDACGKRAVAHYNTLMALSPDLRQDRYRAGILPMVEQAATELRKYGIPTGMQGKVEWRPDGIKLPILGYYDYWWDQHGIVGELKTTERMPSEIKQGHARQVALYANSDNIDARLLYVTPSRMQAYCLENVAEHRAALLRIAMTVERLLSLSDDPMFFVGITVPNMDSFYWSDPAARQLAFEYWGI